MFGPYEITDMSDRVSVPVPIACRKCGQAGTAVWEEEAMPNRKGLKPALVSLSDEFYQRAHVSLATLPEIVCAKCGAVVPD